MPTYHRDYSQTAAPIARVIIHNPNNTALKTEALMLLDTGADLTLLPAIAIANTGIQPIADFYEELLAFDDHKVLAQVAVAIIQLDGRTIRGEFPVIEQSIGVIGRNVLNLFPILFDGPRLTWEILARAHR
jgi:predicted aspartyl protease